MSQKTNIPWCDYTFNPWRGCRKVSEGCANCYIVHTAPLRTIGQKHGAQRVLASEAVRLAPRKWNKKPFLCDVCKRAMAGASAPGRCYNNCWHDDKASYHRGRVFLGSLMDIWDTEIPISYLGDALQMVFECRDLDFLLVSKRPENFMPQVKRLFDHYRVAPCNEAFCCWLENWLDGQAPVNVWAIASAENQDRLEERVPLLLSIPAFVHGLSCEPLLEGLKMSFDKWLNPEINGQPSPGINWVIAGGESGPGARDCSTLWLKDLRNQCYAAGVPFFMKQLGRNVVHEKWAESDREFQNFGRVERLVLTDRKGEDPKEWPAGMAVRQWPTSEERF